MAEIRCPMCGRANPEEHDVCEFCGARLKPLTGALAAANDEPIHPGDEPTPKSTSELEKTLPEWLRNLRKGDEESPGESGPELTSQGEAADDDEFFEHLAALSTQAGSPDEKPAESQPGESPPTDDFLSPLAGLGTAPPAPEPEATPEAPKSAEEDFLAGLSAVAAAPSSEEAATPSSAADESTDWLAGLSSAEAEEEETPEWLKNITGQIEQQAPAASEPAGEEIDWRGQLEGQKETAAVPPPQAEPEWTGFHGEPELPGPEAPERPAESEESLAWLRNLEAQATGTPASAPAVEEGPEPAPSAGETPDWLSGLGTGADTPAPAPAETSGETPVAGEEVPEWLKGLQGPELPGAARTQPTEEDVPEWLKPAAAAGATMSTGEPEAEPAAPAPAEEVPDWLAGMAAAGATMSEVEPEAPAEMSAGAEEAEIPDWLMPATLAAATTVSQKPDEPAPSEAPEAPTAETPPQEEGGVPDWVKAATLAGATMVTRKPEEPAAPLETAAAETAVEPPTLVGARASEAEGETPDWMKGLAAGAAAGAAVSAMRESPEAAGEELFPASMPDWLSEIKPAQEGEAPPALPAGEPAISEGQLPSWVRAMRPVEAAAGEAAGPEEEQFVEESGPLSGFSNVLPAAVGAVGARRVSAYPNKLLVNESQQGQIELLERLVAGERTAKTVGARPRISSNRMLRWGIAALLLAFVLLPIIFSTQLTPTAKLIPPELNATINAINDLPPGAVVLVVVDYEPAFSGELEAAATPLLDQLRLKGATVVFVSSSATGSALADRLVAGVDADLSGAAPQQYVNLGYLTGGASGVTNFVTNPAGAAPHTIAGAPAWQMPPLEGFQSLGDFDAMVVLADSSDTGAIWIEQSRTALGTSPLLMAISAQAEPMLQPYYDSEQVQGMVTGLAGGVAYEQSNGIRSVGSDYWDPYSVGFLVADFIVAVGGVMALLAAWQARRSAPASEAE